MSLWHVSDTEVSLVGISDYRLNAHLCMLHHFESPRLDALGEAKVGKAWSNNMEARVVRRRRREQWKELCNLKEVSRP